MGGRRYAAGDTILVVKRSHRWYWLPHFYRHIGGGTGCHWLRLFFLVERPTDPAAVEAMRAEHERDKG